MKSNLAVLVMCLIALLAIGVVPSNAAVQVNDKTVINLTAFVPCAAGGSGEIVDLNGPLHTLISFAVNGNNFSGKFHFQPQGISGIGETTGFTYHATGVTQETFKASLQNGQNNLTFVNNFRIIGQGSGNNFLVHESLHINFNADGTLTVFHDNFSVDCK
jgi:hypothetical protein